MRLLLLMLLLVPATFAHAQPEREPLTLAVLPTTALDASGADGASSCFGGVSGLACLYGSLRVLAWGAEWGDTDVKVAIGVFAVAAVAAGVALYFEQREYCVCNKGFPGTRQAPTARTISLPMYALHAGRTDPLAPQPMGASALAFVPRDLSATDRQQFAAQGHALGADLLLFSWLHPGQQGVGTTATAPARLEMAVLDTRTGSWLPMGQTAGLGTSLRLTLPLTDVVAAGGPQQVIARQGIPPLATR